VERLSGVDAAFIWGESDRWPMHVTALAVVDPREAPAFSPAAVRDVIASRLDRLPPLRRRLVEVPLQLAPPVWVDDPDFDLDAHVRRIGVPEPGGLVELCAVAAEVAGRRLDRSRPLWELWIVDGLEDGRVGIITKIHHACIDGVSGAELLVHLLDLEPSPPPGADPAPFTGEALPSSWELAARSLPLLPLAQVRALRAVRSTIAGVRRKREAAQAIASSDDEATTADEPGATTPGTDDPDALAAPASTQPLRAPRVSFNGPVSSRRALAVADLPLDLVQQVRHTLGVTVNDVLLAITATALARYLAGRGEHPDRPLLAYVPVSVRTEAGEGFGNALSGMFVSLATDLDDPVDRVRAMSMATTRAKASQKAMGSTLFEEWTTVTAPALPALASRAYMQLRLTHRHAPLFNVMISNVPGPPFPLYLAGARLDSVSAVAPLIDGMGMYIGLVSYCGTVSCSVGVCPDLVPDPWAVTRHLRPALEELVAATAPAPTPGAAAPARRRRSRARPGGSKGPDVSGRAGG
jgi:diacylglycerol O-acyltransferase / wax synthase